MFLGIWFCRVVRGGLGLLSLGGFVWVVWLGFYCWLHGFFGSWVCFAGIVVWYVWVTCVCLLTVCWVF